MGAGRLGVQAKPHEHPLDPPLHLIAVVTTWIFLRHMLVFLAALTLSIFLYTLTFEVEVRCCSDIHQVDGNTKCKFLDKNVFTITKKDFSSISTIHVRIINVACLLDVHQMLFWTIENTFYIYL